MGVSVISNLVSVIALYIIGSIPTGYLIAKYKGVHDLRVHGSGSTGATNAARVLGLHYFFFVFFIDFLKAYLSIGLLLHLGMSVNLVYVAALALLCGNGWPLFIHFKGGKGMATSAGILAAIHPWLFALVFCIWVLLALLFKTIGIASIGALLALSACAPLLVSFPTSFFYYALSIIGLFLHRANLVQQICMPLLQKYRGYQ